jgi:hypothetical protein
MGVTIQIPAIQASSLQILSIQSTTVSQGAQPGVELYTQMPASQLPSVQASTSTQSDASVHVAQPGMEIFEQIPPLQESTVQIF